MDWAVKVYHTSAPGVPVQLEVTVGEEAVAADNVWAVNWLEPLTQEAFVVIGVALAHKSFPGAAYKITGDNKHKKASRPLKWWRLFI